MASTKRDTPKNATKQVGVYARISDDPSQSALGVKRQLQDCRALAKARHVEIAREYVDNDVSAYKRVRRPEFETMIEDLAEGKIDGVFVYNLDRLARRPSDLERLLDIYETRDGLVFASIEGDLNLASGDGQAMARVMIAFAKKSSDDASRRIKRKALELAQEGKPAGGARPFGWKSNKVDLEPAEARVVRKIAKDLLSGISLHEVTRRLRDGAVRTPRGNLWTPIAIRGMIVNPRLAGFRIHRGEIMRDEVGNPIRGVWKPILDEETWGALVEMFKKRHRVRPGAHRYLLSGILVCEECLNAGRHSAMRGNWQERIQGHFYACPSPSQGGCGRNAVNGVRTDDLIEKLVRGYLAQQHVPPPNVEWPKEAELGKLEAKKHEVISELRETLDTRTFGQVIKSLDEALAELRAERAAWSREQARKSSLTDDLDKRWPTLSLDQQRAVIRSVLESVRVKKSRFRGGPYDPDRLTPIWRG